MNQMRFLTPIRNRLSRRSRLARKHLRGVGLEIGALHAPTPLPRGVSVQYVDRLSSAELAAHYPELDSARFVPVDIVDNAETLEHVADRSQDFVVASHVLEHCEDPLGALSSWLRVLRPGGTVLLAVPNRDRTFDRSRDVTSWEHLVRDHEDGPCGSRSVHYLEWATLVEGKAGAVASDHALALEEGRYSIHFHVWDWNGFRDFLDRAQHYRRVHFRIDDVAHGGVEFLAAVRKT